MESRSRSFGRKGGLLMLAVSILLAVAAFYILQLRQTETSLQKKFGDPTIHWDVSEGEDPTPMIAELSEGINECRKLLGNPFASKECVNLMIGLLADRMSVYTEASMYDLAQQDAAEIAQLNKQTGYQDGYISVTCWRAELLCRNGQWHEAVQMCESLLAEVGEDTSYKPYDQLVCLYNRAPDDVPKNPALVDGYRQKALSLTKGDWRER